MSCELAPALAELLHHGTLVLLLDIDGQRLPGLHGSPSIVLTITSGPRDGELVALAAHVLDQHRQMQLAAAATP